jgi:hypothetical protein
MREPTAFEVKRVYRRRFEPDVFCRWVTFCAYIRYIILFVVVRMIFRFMTNYKVVIMMMDSLEKFEKVILRLLDELKPKRAFALL